MLLPLKPPEITDRLSMDIALGDLMERTKEIRRYKYEIDRQGNTAI